MKLLPFCFLMSTIANMSVKPLMNGSPLLMEGIIIPYVKVLWLYLETNGHVYEGRVLQLLTKCSGITELNLSFQVRDEVQDFCLPDCICHNESGIWEAKVVLMRALKNVDIVNFHGSPREVHIVEQLVRRAPRLEVLRVFSNVTDHSLEGIPCLCPPGCNFHIYYWDTRSKEWNN